MFPGERAFEGTRVFTTQGIDKAILNLFRMYAMMGANEVSFSSSGEKDVFTYADMNGMNESADVAGFATAGADGSLEVLVYNHHDNWDLKETWDVNVELANLPFSGRAQLVHYRVDADHSNAYAEWVRQGKPMYPQGEQMAAIKACDGLETLNPPSTVEVKDGKLNLGFSLPVHGISLLKLTPAR
jgi:xylan 1,4-beta-xylosidase